MGYNLANHFGIRHPKFGFAYFDSTVTKVHNNKSYTDNTLFTYTHWIEKSFPITTSKMTKNIDENEIINLLLFDIYIYNTDRNHGNLLMVPPVKLYPIDYTHILPGACLWRDVIKNNEYSLEKIIEDMLSSGFYQYLIEDRKFQKANIENCCKIFITKIGSLDLCEIINKIPKELTKSLSESDYLLLNSYFDYISTSFKEVANIIIQKIGKE